MKNVLLSYCNESGGRRGVVSSPSSSRTCLLLLLWAWAQSLFWHSTVHSLWGGKGSSPHSPPRHSRVWPQSSFVFGGANSSRLVGISSARAARRPTQRDTEEPLGTIWVQSCRPDTVCCCVIIWLWIPSLCAVSGLWSSQFTQSEAPAENTLDTCIYV